MAKLRSESNQVSIYFPFAGDSIGGSIISASLVAKTLSRNPNYCVVGLLHEAGIVGGWLEKQGIKTRYCPEIMCVELEGNIFRRLLKIYRSQKAAREFIISNSVDVIHTNDGRMHITWVLGCIKTSCKHVWHQRTRFSDSRLASLLITLSDRIFVISDYVRSTLPLREANRSRKVMNLLHSDFNVVSKSERKCEIFGWTKIEANKTTVVGYVGTFNRQKRVIDFIDIAHSLCSDNRLVENIYFVLIGKEGDYSHNFIKDLVLKKNLYPRLKVEGYKENIIPWYEAIDILIAPAENEGFGRNIVEAMDRSSVVVASRSGAHPEIVTHMETGLLVEVGDIEQYVASLKAIANSETLRNRLAEAARCEVRKRFSSEELPNIIMSEYSRLLDADDCSWFESSGR